MTITNDTLAELFFSMHAFPLFDLLAHETKDYARYLLVSGKAA